MKTALQSVIPYLILPVAFCAATPVFAATLDAKAARSLISDRVWQQQRRTGSGFVYWYWKSDSSVCIRLEDKNSKCDDTGHWKLDGDRLCFEITWYLKSAGGNSACFRISSQGEGRYEAISDNGLTFFEFTVPK